MRKNSNATVTLPLTEPSIHTSFSTVDAVLAIVEPVNEVIADALLSLGAAPATDAEAMESAAVGVHADSTR